MSELNRVNTLVDDLFISSSSEGMARLTNRHMTLKSQDGSGLMCDLGDWVIWTGSLVGLKWFFGQGVVIPGMSGRLLYIWTPYSRRYVQSKTEHAMPRQRRAMKG